jgi:hypothetical protein
MNLVSPLIPTVVRPGWSVIATLTEVGVGENNTKTVTPLTAARQYVGYYHPGRAYSADECVFFNGGFWTAVQNVQGTSPPNSTFWASATQIDTSSFAEKDPSGGVRIGNNWTIRQVGTELHFVYNGTARVKIASSGMITSIDDVRAFGAI